MDSPSQGHPVEQTLLGEPWGVGALQRGQARLPRPLRLRGVSTVLHVRPLGRGHQGGCWSRSGQLTGAAGQSAWQPSHLPQGGEGRGSTETPACPTARDLVDRLSWKGASRDWEDRCPTGVRTATPRPRDCPAGPTTGVRPLPIPRALAAPAHPSVPTRSPCAARAPAPAPAPALAPLCPPCARVGASSAPAPAARKLSGGDAGWRWRRRRRGGGGSGPRRWREESGSQGSPPAPPHSAPGRARSPVPRFLPADSCPVALNPADTQP